jgi:hypothetical protein
MLEQISGKELKFVEVKGLRPYDNNNWYSLNPVPTMPLYDALKQTYEYYKK